MFLYNDNELLKREIKKSISGFQGGSVVKNSPANTGDTGSIPGWGRSPGEGDGNPLQYSIEEPGWRHKESDTTEHKAHLHQYP